MPIKEYVKDGKRCLLCASRKKLIRITPEEIVRQNFIDSLVSDFDFPEEMILAEVPLSHIQKGAKGRADIIVFGKSKNENLHFPLMLVECKEPSVPITDRVAFQVLQYDSVIQAKVIVITNGTHTEVYNYIEEIKDYVQIKEIPTYYDLIENDFFKPTEFENLDYSRPDFKIIDNKTIEYLQYNGLMGQDSNPLFYSLIINMLGLINDTKFKIESLLLPDRKFLEDGGIRYTTFGNASGGSFTGDYRYLIFEMPNGENQIISFSIMAKLSATNHPIYGNSRGLTLLLFAIDDYEDSHLSLEYAIDRFVISKDNMYTFWHDGTLTAGKKGRVKNQEVLAFVENRCPELIRDGKIYLGQLDNSHQLLWSDNNVKELFQNFITYSFLRDEFRRTKR